MLRIDSSINEQIRDALLVRLKSHFFIPIINIPGSPLPSIIKNELCPLLANQAISGMAGNEWVIVQVKPGLNPMQNLASSLTTPGVVFEKGAVGVDVLQRLQNLILEGGSLGLNRFYEEVVKIKGSAFNLFIIVEQFETLLLNNTYFKERGTPGIDIDFVNLLLKGVMEEETPIYLLTSIYPNFVNQLIKYQGLPELIHRGRYDMPKLQPQQISAFFEEEFSNPSLKTMLVNAAKQTEWDNYPKIAFLKEFKDLNAARPEVLAGFTGAIPNLTSLSELFTQTYLDSIPQKDKIIIKKVFQQLVEKNIQGINTFQPKTFAELGQVIYGSSLDELKFQELYTVLNHFNKANFSFCEIDDSAFLKSSRVEDIVIRLQESIIIEPDTLFDKWRNEALINQSTFNELEELAQKYYENPQSSYLLEDTELLVAQKWKETLNPNAQWVSSFKQTGSLDDNETALARIDQFIAQSQLQEEEKNNAEQKAQQTKLRKLFLTSLLFIAIALFSIFMAIRGYLSERDTKLISSNLTYFTQVENLKDKNRIPRNVYLDIRAKILDTDPNQTNDKVDAIINKVGKNKALTSELNRMHRELIRTATLKNELYVSKIGPLIDSLNNLYNYHIDEPDFEHALFYELCTAFLEDLEVRESIKSDRFIQNFKGNIDIAIDPIQEEKYIILDRLGNIIEPVINAEKGIKEERILTNYLGLTDIAYDALGKNVYGVTAGGEMFVWLDDEKFTQKHQLVLRKNLYLYSIHPTEKEYTAFVIADDGLYLISFDAKKKIAKIDNDSIINNLQINHELDILIAAGEHGSFVYEIENQKNSRKIRLTQTMFIQHKNKYAIDGSIDNRETIALGFEDGDVVLFPLERGKNVDLSSIKHHHTISPPALYSDSMLMEAELKPEETTIGSIDFLEMKNKRHSQLAVAYYNGLVQLITLDYSVVNQQSIFEPNVLEVRGNQGPVTRVAFNNNSQLISMDNRYIFFWPTTIDESLTKIDSLQSKLEIHFKDQYNW